MSLRYLGAILIFISCGATGFLMAENYQRETRCISQLLRLLSGMQNELEYRLTPIPTLCEYAAQEATGSLRTVFLTLSHQLQSQEEENAAACMEIALGSATNISPRVQEILSTLGRSLGKFDLQGQINELSALRNQCQLQLEQMQDKQELRLRSYRTMGLCLGAGLAILFL